MAIEDRLQELHIILPEVQAAGNYLPAVKTGNLVFVSGQLPKIEGKIAFRGRVGKDFNLETARRAAKACVANCLAVLKQELGSLEKIKKIIKVNGFVNTYPGFHDHPKVMDAASDLLIEIFGEAGRHARAVVGVVELPMGAAMEMEMIVETR
ncbi:MAG: RidA family protein [Deltaproteobacteria bacterium]|nr:RidA family protein [Deltaproteobacteria bacterium]